MRPEITLAKHFVYSTLQQKQRHTTKNLFKNCQNLDQNW